MEIAQYALEAGKNPASSDVTKIIAIGESVRDISMKPLPIAAHLEELWEAGVYSSYATTEIATSFCECEFRQGGHLRPELAVVEILNEDDDPVEDGKPGEVVVTPLGITGTPLLRFRTGDISFLIKDKCMCGRNTPRLGPILGRKKQMLKYKGKTIFPNTILSVMEGKDFFYGGYVEAHRNHDYSDNVTLYAALSDESVSIDRLKSEIESRLDVAPNIVVVSKEEIDKRLYNAEDRRKRTTFFDLR
jgi:phenylacetate-CoA ligase